jgi:hypothetical protein
MAVKNINEGLLHYGRPITSPNQDRRFESSYHYGHKLSENAGKKTEIYAFMAFTVKADYYTKT